MIVSIFCRLCRTAMDGASTRSAFDELDFGTERHSTNIPVDVDLPPFEVRLADAGLARWWT